jgi:O-acetyl-ADP-ribose deacetylase (regulator of RNase III)
MEEMGDQTRLPMPAHANGRPGMPAQRLEQDNGRVADGTQRTARYPAGLLDAPVAALLDEVMFWRNLDARGVSRFDQIKDGLQDVMNRPQIPLPPAHLRKAKVKEIRHGNLFNDAPPGAAMAHCVGADFVMGAGLAVEFRERYGHERELRAGNHQPGTVATVPLFKPDSDEVDKYIFHLVTKPTSRYCLPRWWELIYAVRDLARLCKELGVKTVAMPQIGAGLDRQRWWKVRRVIDIEFAGSDTEVLVFHHPSEHPANECRNNWTSPPPSQLVDFIDPLLPKTTPANRPYSHAVTNQTPPFSTPDSATPSATTTAPGGTWSCPLPDEGVHSTDTVGPCAAKVLSEKKQDVGHDVDSIKTLTTAQGPDRSVQNSSSTTPTIRFLNDLQKSTRHNRRSSSIPRPITPTNLPNIETQTLDTLNSAPDMCSLSDPQNQRLPLNDEEAGRRPEVSLSQRSSVSHPAESQEGAAQNRTAKQKNGLLLGGPRPHSRHQPPRPNLVTGGKNIQQRYPKPPN